MFDWDELPDDTRPHSGHPYTETESEAKSEQITEVLVKHVNGGDAVSVSVAKVATLLDVKRALAKRLQRPDILKKGRLVQDAGPRSFSPLQEMDLLGTRRHIFITGVDDLVMQRGQVQNLTVSTASRMQSEFAQSFADPYFQQRIVDFGRSQGFARKRHQLIRSTQFSILPKYGFEASEQGVEDMMVEMRALMHHDEIARNSKYINELLRGADERNSKQSLSNRSSGSKEYSRKVMPVTWKPPTPSFQLGEYFWANDACLERCRMSDFFPRFWFGALVLPDSDQRVGQSLLLLGGSKDSGIRLNDVWRLSVPRIGIHRPIGADGEPLKPQWSLVSPVETASIDANGHRTIRKWQGRSDFGCCVSDRLIFVAGGTGSNMFFADVWASENEGRKWACMNNSAPWGRRFAPALCGVPGRSDRLVLAGGMAAGAEPKSDAWISDDAGISWTELERPPWGITSGRYRSAFIPLARMAEDAESESRMLLLGGCFIDGTGGGYGGVERLTHDGWECRIDWACIPKRSSATWTIWGEQWNAEDRSEMAAKSGVELPTATWDPLSRSIVARLPERDFVCIAEARRPDPGFDCMQWFHAPLSLKHDLVAATKRDLHLAASKIIYVRLMYCRLGFVPRIVFISTSTVLVSSDGEWRRQAFFVLLLGLRLEKLMGLPGDLWRGRVCPCVLPAL